jgi:2-C-methyl-D-erythritol 4-phosphate cytidylyltransferase/2-C-methyl-D-erythritol 2,4-cyclodiphosphate synthase
MAQAVIPVIPVVDTIKIIENTRVTQTLKRENLAAVQTPQGFDYQTLYALHQQQREDTATDDATLVEQAGIPVHTVAGERSNRKITHPEDGEDNIMRTGLGFDVHQLVTTGATGFIRLCGVDVPCDARLEGHSDGDVGLHALTDAIFGALAEGDLGVHFPSSDPKWKGKDSSAFLLYAKALMDTKGAKLLHADVTIIAQKPQVSPYREAMRNRIAEILEISVEQISVKATTTDGLGFTGRGEGIAAQAVVTVTM